MILSDLSREAATEVLRYHEGADNAVLPLPEGRFASAGEDGRIAVWRVGERDPTRAWRPHEGPIVALALSPDGSTALATSSVSPDGQYLAYGLSQGGSDFEELHVRSLRDGRDLPDTVHWVKFSGISWTADNKGFFYSRFPAPAVPAV